MLFVTPVNKKSHEVERLRTTTVSFPVVLFHSKSNRYIFKCKISDRLSVSADICDKKSEYRFLDISVHHYLEYIKEFCSHV